MLLKLQEWITLPTFTIQLNSVLQFMDLKIRVTIKIFAFVAAVIVKYRWGIKLLLCSLTYWDKGKDGLEGNTKTETFDYISNKILAYFSAYFVKCNGNICSGRKGEPKIEFIDTKIQMGIVLSCNGVYSSGIEVMLVLIILLLLRRLYAPILLISLCLETQISGGLKISRPLGVPIPPYDKSMFWVYQQLELKLPQQFTQYLILDPPRAFVFSSD